MHWTNLWWSHDPARNVDTMAISLKSRCPHSYSIIHRPAIPTLEAVFSSTIKSRYWTSFSCLFCKSSSSLYYFKLPVFLKEDKYILRVFVFEFGGAHVLNPSPPTTLSQGIQQQWPELKVLSTTSVETGVPGRRCTTYRGPWSASHIHTGPLVEHTTYFLTVLILELPPLTNTHKQYILSIYR